MALNFTHLCALLYAAQKIDMLSEVSTEAMDIVQVNLERIQSSEDFAVSVRASTLRPVQPSL